jgi:hypothetical protein
MPDGTIECARMPQRQLPGSRMLLHVIQLGNRLGAWGKGRMGGDVCYPFTTIQMSRPSRKPARYWPPDRAGIQLFPLCAAPAQLIVTVAVARVAYRQ